MKHVFTALLSLCFLLSLAACSGTRPSSPPEYPSAENGAPADSALPEEADPEPLDPNAIPSGIQKFLDVMTLEEKAGQLFFVRCPAENAVSDVETYHLGGYLLFGRDFQDKTANDVIQTVAAYQNAAAIPLLIGVDEEGGTVVRVSSNPNLRSSKFKSPQKILAEGGLDALRQDTREKDRLLDALGINVNFSPVCDVSTNPEDFIYARSFGQDAAATAEDVSAMVTQMSADNMGSVLKHFPGYGNNADTHTGIAVDSRPLETFQSSDFLPFYSFAAGGGKTAVLVSHNIVQCMDSNLPASLSPAVHDVLRQELGFDGVVMTDDLAMEAVAAYAKDGAVAVMALQAGNDMVVTTDYRTQIPGVIAAVESGTLEEETIDRACARVLQWKAALGLLVTESDAS